MRERNHTVPEHPETHMSNKLVSQSSWSSRQKMCVRVCACVCGAGAVTAGPSGVCMSRKWRSRRGEGLEPQTRLGLGPEQTPPSLPLWPWPRPITEQGHMTSHIMLLSYHMRCISVGTCRVTVWLQGKST